MVALRWWGLSKAVAAVAAEMPTRVCHSNEDGLLLLFEKHASPSLHLSERAQQPYA
jgi:hypothetical protein